MVWVVVGGLGVEGCDVFLLIHVPLAMRSLRDVSCYPVH